MSVQFKDYYATLGIGRQATADEIKRAYRKLAREHHPDRAAPADRTEAETRIKEINEAYEVLKDPEKRRKYDQLGANWDRADWRGSGAGAGGFGPFGDFTRARGGPEVHFGGTGFSDFFEQFFGGGAADFGSFDHGGSRRGSHQPSASGADVEADLMVSLIEAAHGATRPLSLRVTDPQTGAEQTISFKVRIPAGVREGQRLRVPGKGGRAHGGGKPGDLFLRVHLEPHPDFRVRGKDLYHELPLAPWEAVLGAKVDLPTLDGSVRLSVPAGTPNGRQFRLRGRGLPAADKGAAGDLYAVVSIEIPETVTPAEQAEWEKLARSSTFNPRS